MQWEKTAIRIAVVGRARQRIFQRDRSGATLPLRGRGFRRNLTSLATFFTVQRVFVQATVAAGSMKRAASSRRLIRAIVIGVFRLIRTVWAAVQGKNGAGYIDKIRQGCNSFSVCPCGYFQPWGCAGWRRDRGFFIDRSGRRLTPRFQAVQDYFDEFVAVRSAGQSQVTCLNSRGKQVSRARCVWKYDSAGLRPVQIGGRWGHKNARGKWVIQALFEHASDFEEGLAAVRVGEKAGFIDRHGKVVIAPQFAGAWGAIRSSDGGYRLK